MAEVLHRLRRLFTGPLLDEPGKCGGCGAIVGPKRGLRSDGSAYCDEECQADFKQAWREY